eukprot:scaffold26633_cov140-Isochrysis_galbana.AAC.3
MARREKACHEEACHEEAWREEAVVKSLGSLEVRFAEWQKQLCNWDRVSLVVLGVYSDGEVEKQWGLGGTSWRVCDRVGLGEKRSSEGGARRNRTAESDEYAYEAQGGDRRMAPIWHTV